jgi:hypothetical protein
MLTHDELWAGVDLKIENAQFHFDAMIRVLQPQSPERVGTYTIEGMGTVISGSWHRPFYAHFDAFLSASRSVPEIIRCCFGVDTFIEPDRRVSRIRLSDKTSRLRPRQVVPKPAHGARIMKEWYEARTADERERRSEFQEKFKLDYDAFRTLPLSTARNISEHRTGAAPVTVKVTGRFGVVYDGGPTRPIPTSETREMPSGFGFLSNPPTPVQPTWADFNIDGAPLFETCRDYLDSARDLADRARALAQEVHGESEITRPPTDM